MLFTIGCDSKGRSCAVNARHLNDGGRITELNILALISLLLLPVISLHLLGVKPFVHQLHTGWIAR